MSTLPLLSDSLTAFAKWLDARGRELGRSHRLLETACRKIIFVARQYAAEQLLEAEDLESLDWWLARGELLFRLLVKEGLTDASATSYVSRFRRTVRMFRTGKLPPKEPQHLGKPQTTSAVQVLPAPPVSAAAQFAEVINLLDRWPDLAVHLRAALAKASAEIFGSPSASPKSPRVEDNKK